MLAWPDETIDEGIASVAATDPERRAVIVDETVWRYDDPLSDDEPHEKFRMCAGHAPETVAVDDAPAALDELRTVSDVSDVLGSR
ncbi:hypothetical protein ACFQE6_04025, partial [Natrinema soli]